MDVSAQAMASDVILGGLMFGGIGQSLLSRALYLLPCAPEGGEQGRLPTGWGRVLFANATPGILFVCLLPVAMVTFFAAPGLSVRILIAIAAALAVLIVWLIVDSALLLTARWVGGRG